MLVLTRKVNEEVQIGDNINIIIVSIRGRQVRLGIAAPREVAIRRDELAPRAGPPAQAPPEER